MRDKPRAVIWGASGHALTVADILLLSGYELFGFIDDVNPGRKGEGYFGHKVLGGKESLPSVLAAGVDRIVIGIGDNGARAQLASIATEMGFVLTVAIHPGAIVAESARVGDGSVVAAGAVINPMAQVGDNVIVNTGATVDHHCVIGSGAHIAPGANLCGNVVVEKASFVGAGSVIREKTHIGRGVIVGAGSVVLNNVPDHVLVAGAPARVVRKLSE